MLASCHRPSVRGTSWRVRSCWWSVSTFLRGNGVGAMDFTAGRASCDGCIVRRRPDAKGEPADVADGEGSRAASDPQARLAQDGVGAGEGTGTVPADCTIDAREA